jgi:hypothetical protein
MRRALRRAPLIAAAIASLAYGAWLGLVRIGWILPLPWPDQLILHGPLMIGGFLGTLIGLERAIGVAHPWAYAAPLLSGAGALWLVLGSPGPAGPVLITVSAAIVTCIFVTIVWRHATVSGATLLAGCISWLIGNALWASGFAIYRVVFWWIAFLVLTIGGERLELNRMLQPTRVVQVAFIASVSVVVSGAALTVLPSPITGVRVVGAGLLGVTAWLATCDIARRTIRQRGVTRYIAICMLTSYAWLGIAGGTALVSGAFEPGFVHDALLHTLFLGFAITMVFGHAPIVFPAITGRAMAFTMRFYVPYALLQASVALRLAGDLIDAMAGYRAWGGLLNALALLAFVLNVATTVRRGSS